MSKEAVTRKRSHDDTTFSSPNKKLSAPEVKNVIDLTSGLNTCIFCKITWNDDSNFQNIKCAQCNDKVCFKCLPKFAECGSCEKYGDEHICAKCCKGKKCAGAGWLVCSGCIANCLSGDCGYCRPGGVVKCAIVPYNSSSNAHNSSGRHLTSKGVDKSNDLKKSNEMAICSLCRTTWSLAEKDQKDVPDVTIQCAECKKWCCGACYHKWEECGPCEKYSGGESNVCADCCRGKKCAGAGWLVCSNCVRNCYAGDCGYCHSGGVFKSSKSSYSKPYNHSDSEDDIDDIYYSSWR